ncbi:CbtA family protein [Cupriavidus agavae]|uniref:Putative cobalt transporter subunit CbtA n=1 Tax=Cupriavidus agavae TaxID=1001822 RepID=A0A4Q7S7R3_9BURK|nr:CbtA family protein [Cupriavidus agavae]RZT42471.1 putative cobalt transporter subunit CbtA [Cupriavidus agavae]
MVRDLLVRGMLAGFLASVLAFVFAHMVGEPQVDRAIAFEEQMAHAMGGSHQHEMPELVSRETQSGLGLFVGLGVFGAAVGGLFALAFAYVYGRIGALGARATALLMAGLGFVAIVLVPFLKYPPNPPAIGDPSTIGLRTGLFFTMIGLSLAAMVVAVIVARQLAARRDAWHAWLGAGAVFVVLALLGHALLPGIDEVPDHFPATLLWQYRMATFGIQAVLWGALGVMFAGFAKGVVER